MSTKGTITIKVNHPVSSTTRKLLLPATPTPAYAFLVETVLSRFSLSGPAELVYKDEDGDLITLSSDEELAELIRTAQLQTTPLRFQLNEIATATKSETDTSTERVFESTVSVSPRVPEARDIEGADAEEVEDKEEEWTSVQAAETSESVTPSIAVEHPTTPTLLFEDPDETPLPSTSELAQEQAAQEFPATTPSSTVSSSDAFPDDPLDLPLPSDSADALPFSNLPNSLSSFLASLGTRSSTFSSTLASALSPTSPYSPTSRLSTILSASSLDDIPLVASSLVQMGSEFAEIAKGVALGVRREADEIRGEFTKLREEVEREREKFRDELRGAFEQAGTNEDRPQEDEEEEEELEQEEPATPVATSSSAVPRPPPSYVQPLTRAESSRSSTASSSVAPSSSQTPQPGSSSSSPAVTRETSRLLRKQAKQARKDYRAAVRQARQEKKRSRCERSETTEGVEGQGSDYKIPGGMPSTSEGKLKDQ